MSASLHIRDIDQIGFQRKEWAVQRVGWAALAIFLLAALLGVFSIGVLSETTAGSPEDGVEVTYERFNRQMGMTEMHIAVDDSAVQNQKAEVFISQDLLAGMRIEGISPEPDSVTGTRQGATYEFAAESGSPPVIEIVYRPADMGSATGTIRAGDSGGVEISMLTYP